MKSKTLQEMVKSIFCDESTREQFFSDPDSVMSRYNLTDNEKTAVLNTTARYGLATQILYLWLLDLKQHVQL